MVLLAPTYSSTTHWTVCTLVLGLTQLYYVSTAPGACDMGSGPHQECHTVQLGPPWLSFSGHHDPVLPCSGRSMTLPQHLDWAPLYRLPLVRVSQLRTRMRPRPIGEAINPGPPIAITIGNPTGLRSKEIVAYGLPRGIVNLSETHLAQPGVKACCQLLRSTASRDNRRLWLLPGASVPLRARSQSTGVWAGVFQFADVPAHCLRLPFPNAEHTLGRVQVSCFNLGPLQITGVVLYGWTPGPTWPQAKQANRALLQHLTLEVVHGRAGPRYISGDFNCADCDAFHEWSSLGWQEVQDLHFLQHHEGPFPTCKGRTQPDRIFISPELRQYYVKTEVADTSADHSTVTAWFDLPVAFPTQRYWPMPAKLPWSSIDIPQWQQGIHQVPEPSSWGHATTSYFEAFGLSYEDSLTGYVQPATQQGLLPAHRGRAQHHRPQERALQPPTLKPSRRGEEAPVSDFLGRIHFRWFTQLRRLQSLLHNLRRASSEPSAIEYRLLTWQAIKKARGFNGGFPAWWAHRPIITAGASFDFPLDLPTCPLLEAIFDDFLLNYKNLESWNVRQRCSILRAKREEHLAHSFRDVSLRERAPVTSITVRSEATVIFVDPETYEVHTDQDIPEGTDGDWLLEDSHAQVTRTRPFTFRIDTDVLLCPGQLLQCSRQLTDPVQMLDQFNAYWSKRWHKPPGESDWQRVLAFARAYMPPGHFPLAPLSVSAWNNNNKRYHARSARGPDGFDHLDLLLMPDQYKQQLVQLLADVESGLPWPTQLQRGFCHPLPKFDTADEVAHVRPIVIFPTIYRSWSSLRASSIIQQLGRQVPSGVHGFLPHREAGDVWHATQALRVLPATGHGCGWLCYRHLQGFRTHTQEAALCHSRASRFAHRCLARMGSLFGRR